MLIPRARSRRTYFQKVFITHGLVVALPVLMLCVLIYQGGVRNVRREIIEGQNALCNQIGSSVYERLKDTAFMTTVISQDDNLIHLSPEQPDRILARLQDYWHFNRLFSDIMLYDLHGKYYSAKDGLLDCFPLYRSFSEREQAFFNSYVTDRKNHLAYFSQGNTVAWIAPVEERGFTIIGLVDRQLLFDLCDISGIDSLYNGSLILFDAQGQIALYIDRGNVLEYRDGKARLNLKDGDLVSNYPLSEFGWSLATVLPGRCISSRTQTSILALWIVGIIVFSCLLVFIVSKWHHQPIQRLSNLAGQEEECDPDYSSNELDSIGTALAAGQLWTDQALYEKGILRETLVLRLISGGVTPQEDLPDTLKHLDMLINAQAYQVLVMHHPSNHEGSVSHELLLNYIEVRYSRKDIAYAVETETDNMRLVVLLIKINTDTAPSPVELMIHDLRLFIRHRMKTEFYFGVGSPHILERISISYIEAVTALYQCTVQDNTTVLYYQNLPDSQVLESRYNPEFQKKLQLYRSSLRAANDSAAWQVLSELEKECMDTATWRYSADRITDVVVQMAMSETADSLRQDPEFTELSHQLNLALSATSGEEHRSLMQKITQLCLDIMHRQEERRNNESKNSLLQWIQEHLCNPNLSLEMLTATFGFSPSYWSRLFTEQIGVSFNDWVWQSRKTIVKDRLIHSDETIRAIIQKVGYTDVPSFSRRFKAEEGMPPGQYRAMSKH